MKHSDLTPFYVMTVILAIFVLVAFAISVIDAILNRKRHRQLKKEKQDCEYEKLLVSARLQLRERIIKYVRKDIHRSISVDIIGAKRKLESTLKSLRPQELYEINAALDLLTKSVEGLRNVERDFVTDVIREDGLLEIVRQEKQKIEKFYGAIVEYKTVGEPVLLDDEKELVIFSIIQEAFVNALRSGDGPVIGLKICYLTDSLIVEIANYLKGFDPSHFFSKDQVVKGLPDIRQRAALLNGWCLFDKTRDNAICVKIPY